MQKLCFVSTLIAAFAFHAALVQAQTVTVTVDVAGVITVLNISQNDRLALENDLLDLADWIVKAIEGKINKTRGRMIRQGIAVLRAAGRAVPASDDAVINALAARPDYKNRVERDAAVP